MDTDQPVDRMKALILSGGLLLGSSLFSLPANAEMFFGVKTGPMKILEDKEFKEDSLSDGAKFWTGYW